MKKKFFSSYLLSWIIAIIAIGSIIAFSFQAFRIENAEALIDTKEYKYHFVMIVENRESTFWQDVYLSAKAEGEKNGALVELIGDNISEEYSVSELLEIAIYQEVDGILLEPSSEENMEELINTAVEKGIPVVTLMNDIQTSKRQTFVGISKYNLGEKYGNELLRILNEDSENNLETKDESINIVVLEANRDANSNGVNYNNEQIYAGIISTVHIPNVNIISMEINNVSAFGAEEYIRNLIMETSIKADVIVCVNLTQTESTCQAVIDFNKVGETRILGYFVSDTVLDAIETGVMDATFVVDTEEIGAESINRLVEHLEEKRVTDYVSINIEMIDKMNVAEYRNNTEEVIQERENVAR